MSESNAFRFRRVWVLGSGFSKSFHAGLPTLKDLNEALFAPLGPQFAPLENFCREFLQLCRHQPQYKRIEEIATVVLGRSIYRDEEDRLRWAELRYLFLKWVRNAVLVTAQPKPHQAKILDAWLAACRNPRSETRRGDLIISFNYDLLLEDRLRNLMETSLECAVELGVPIESADPVQGGAVARCSLDLLKLHGSLDWYRIKGSEGSDLRTICRVGPGDPSWPLYQRDNPLFIPMAHTKDTFLRGNLFTLLWNKADHYMEQAEEIRFLGYGFPATDTNNLLFLLRHRERIREVVVFEDDASAELMRIRNLLGPESVVNSDACAWLARYLQK